jgi:hypothetical protein
MRKHFSSISDVIGLHRQLMKGAILLAMLSMTMSISLRQRERAPPGEQLREPLKHFKNATKQAPQAPFKHIVNATNGSVPIQLGKNVKIYVPQVQAVGSLILLMGMGGDHSWNLNQWWYLDTTWPAKDQEWCCKDPTSLECTCWFDDNDKAAVLRLRENLRIVDAVGTTRYRTGSAWYKYDWWPDGAPVTAEHEAAIANVFQIIEHEYQVLGDYRRIAIAGMSQGADLALSVGVRFPQQLGMVVSERGLLHPPSENVSSHGTPFILTGGDADELIPLATFKGSCASLVHMQTPAFLKTHVCYDLSWGCHGSFMKTEWKLLINAFSLMLFPVHERNWVDQIGHLTFWSSCDA